MSGAPVTVDDLKVAKMRGEVFLDGDFYTNVYRCVEYPELTKTMTGPGYSTRVGQHSTTFAVDGIKVAKDLQAIADAINVHRANRLLREGKR